MHILFFRVILNVVKNLETQSGCIQILRDAQNDTLIGSFYFDTPSFFDIIKSIK